jgi:hypothetical protein
MNFFRDAAIIALSAGSFAIPASFAQQDAGELEHKVDKVFARSASYVMTNLSTKKATARPAWN